MERLSNSNILSSGLNRILEILSLTIENIHSAVVDCNNLKLVYDTGAECETNVANVNETSNSLIQIESIATEMRRMSAEIGSLTAFQSMPNYDIETIDLCEDEEDGDVLRDNAPQLKNEVTSSYNTPQQDPIEVFNKNFIQFERECPICYDTVATKDMIFVSCSHSYCRSCFEKLYDDKCPLCMAVMDKCLRYEMLGNNIKFHNVTQTRRSESRTTTTVLSHVDSFFNSDTSDEWNVAREEVRHEVNALNDEILSRISRRFNDIVSGIYPNNINNDFDNDNASMNGNVSDTSRHPASLSNITRTELGTRRYERRARPINILRGRRNRNNHSLR